MKSCRRKDWNSTWCDEPIPPNYEGMVTRFGTIHHKEAGLRVVIPLIDSVTHIYSGFDTDFVSGATCVCQDNVVGVC